MKARTFAPRKLDMAAFIESGEEMSGAMPVQDWPRLAEDLAKDADVASLKPLAWRAQGRQVAQRIGGPQLWLDLSAHGEIARECQRCLHAVTLPLSIETSIRFVKDEAAAAELDADCDDDVLALSRQFDLQELIEDELIMAQPIVPRHDQCPTDVAALMNAESEAVPPGHVAPAAQPGEATTASGKPNPFAVLASLKKDRS
ncbi:MAG: DUF177 domain-containing protein [Aquabacterium sp.]|uniref:YceD family protein n=1 Tax=Aquabacterium sp. TaxID=1872578 RepID=UPI0011FB7AAD|nr:YceD family protein [Aquabacterium sp.]TAK98735.1 MAG: DUF177 domain-containing protein [Aquabacterium sp.]